MTHDIFVHLDWALVVIQIRVQLDARWDLERRLLWEQNLFAHALVHMLLNDSLLWQKDALFHHPLVRMHSLDRQSELLVAINHLLLRL